MGEEGVILVYVTGEREWWGWKGKSPDHSIYTKTPNLNTGGKRTGRVCVCPFRDCGHAKLVQKSSGRQPDKHYYNTNLYLKFQESKITYNNIFGNHFQEVKLKNVLIYYNYY